MKFEFNNNHAGMLLECLDREIKQVGIRGVYNVAELTYAVQNPVEQNEESFVVELSEEQVERMKVVLDTAVKQVGLNGAANVLMLANILQSPLLEEAAVEEAAEAGDPA